jgi:DNA polymerase type B, organellar and viral
MTISRLALNIFLKKDLSHISSYTPVLKNEKAIPLINKRHIYDFIYNAYYGGITEVYKPYGKNLKYIDVNSLYPFSALNPLPGCSCSYIESYDLIKPLDLDNLFGFFYAKVVTDNGYLGLLPLRTDKGLIFTNGEFEGTWTSEELKFARDHGYKIKVIKGYNFNKVNNVFDKYVKDLYLIKKQNKGSIRQVAKSLLNNLLGRFGLNIIKPITDILNKKEIDYISSTRLLKSHKFIMEDKVLVTYLPGLNKEICFEHGIDPQKVFEFESNENNRKELPGSLKSSKLATFSDTSIAISAMVNSYARIYMHKIKLDILKRGGVIYYSDTDLLITVTFILINFFTWKTIIN